MKTTLLSIALLLCVSLTYGATIYVDADAVGANNGNTWADAFTDLQDALGAASSGDEIWVAEGTYLPIDEPAPNFNERNTSFELVSGVSLYGGFDGSENQLAERDWEVNETVLSGSIGSNQSSDNSIHVVYGSNISSNTRLDGFVVEHGYASDGDQYGGGLLLRNGSLTVANCVFRNNYSPDGGGAIAHTAFGAVSTGILTLQHCRLHNNEGGFGAALYLRGTLSNITDCLIDNNDGSSAVYINNGESVMDKTVVAGNICGSLAAVNVGDFTNAAGKIYNSLIVGNFSTGFRSAVRIDGSGIGSNELINCTVADNRTTDSDASAVSSGDNTVVANCIFWGNVGGPGHEQLGLLVNNPTNCIVEGGFSGISGGGTNIITSDPGFVQPGIAAAAPFDTTGLNYHVSSATSPAVNNGENVFTSALYNEDLNDSTRISAGTVDIGCYEYAFCDAGSVSISTSGPTDFCEGDFIVLTAPQASSYEWSNGASSQEITVVDEGTYSVAIIDGDGCFGSASVTTTVYPASVSINGELSFCEGETTVLTATSPNGSIFSWDSGTTGASTTVSQPGMQTVTVTTTNNCTASESVTVQEVVVPTPSIFQNGFELTSSSATGNQWYLNGIDITGATDQVFNVTQNGQYTVIVTENGCASQSSNTININDVSVAERNLARISVFPNPTSGALQVSVPRVVAGPVRLTVHNALGQMVIERSVSAGIEVINLEPLEQGVYLLTLSDNEATVVRRIGKH